MNTDLQAELNEMNEQVVAMVLGQPVKRKALEAAFNSVADENNWKMPIDAVVILASDAELLTLTEAVKFFAGCTPTYEPIRRAKKGCVYHVKAAGYYAAVGA